jgi:hypothetical protein
MLPYGNQYFGADPNALAAQQLATLFAGAGHPRMGFGVDTIGLDSFGGGGIERLAADALAADALFGADPTPQNAMIANGTKQRLAQAMQQAPQMQMNPAIASQSMQELQRKALAFAAGQTPFSATSEQSTQVKNELLPIPPTTIPGNPQGGTNSGLLAPSTLSFAVTPTRSMQINSIMFSSLDPETAACVLMAISILGVDQLNGPGGIPCSLLTEVRTQRVLKGGTAQAGQQILITIGNAKSVAPVVIRGTLEGPDLVRVT